MFLNKNKYYNYIYVKFCKEQGLTPAKQSEITHLLKLYANQTRLTKHFPAINKTQKCYSFKGNIIDYKNRKYFRFKNKDYDLVELL